MVGTLGRGAGGPGVHTINAKNIDGGPPGRQCRRSESTHYQCKKMSTAGPLGGAVGGRGAPTINAKIIDGEHPGRWCQRSGSTHHQRKKHRRKARWEVVPKV
jgi:hypothetical protein